MTEPYRQQVSLYQDVWDWDIILLHGDVNIICMATGCLWEDDIHHDCDCMEKPRLSSPVLDRFGKRMEEGSYKGDELTGEARPLLDVWPGSEIPVMSGKTYRLNGPRKSHDGFSSGSIWLVYAEEDQPDPPPSFWGRLFNRLFA